MTHNLSQYKNYSGIADSKQANKRVSEGGHLDLLFCVGWNIIHLFEAGMLECWGIQRSFHHLRHHLKSPGPSGILAPAVVEH